VADLNVGDAAARTLAPLDGTEYTYATTRLDMRARLPQDTLVPRYRVLLNEPVDADPDAAEDNLGDVFVRSPSGAVAAVMDGQEE